MKKIFATAIIALCGTVANVNAQTVVYTSNPADSADFGPQVYAQANNYREFVEKKSLRTWKVEAPIGNNTETVPVLWSANREGLSLEVAGMGYNFDDHFTVGVSGGVVYQRKYIGGYVHAGAAFGADEARTSERYGEKFTQYHLDAGVMSPSWETKINFSKNACPSIFSVRIYAGINFKKCKDYKTDVAGSVTTTETDDEIIITTTKKYGDLDARPHVWGWEAGIRFQLDFGGSPAYIFGQAGYGKSQNFTYSEPQLGDAIKVKFGFGWRIFDGHGFAKAGKGSKNRYLYEDYGYSRKEVKRWNL